MTRDAHCGHEDGTRLAGALVWGVAAACLGTLVAAIAGAPWWGLAAAYVLGGVAGMLAAAALGLARSRPATERSDLGLGRNVQSTPT